MADQIDNWQATVTRVVVGTGQIGGRRWRWIWEREDERTPWKRAVLRVIGTGFLVYAGFALGIHWPWVGVAEMVGLLWYGHAKAELEEAEQQPEDGEPELTAEEDILGQIVGIIGDGPGIHLDTLLPILQQQPRCEDMTREQLRAVLAEVGCPIRRALRVGTRTGVAGVHRDDAQAALDALYEAAEPLPWPETPSEL